VKMHRVAISLKKNLHTCASRDKFSFIIEYTSTAENSFYTRLFAQTHTHVSATGCHLLRSGKEYR